MTTLRILQMMSASTNIILSCGVRIANTTTKTKTKLKLGNGVLCTTTEQRQKMTFVRGQKGKKNDIFIRSNNRWSGYRFVNHFGAKMKGAE